MSIQLPNLENAIPYWDNRDFSKPEEHKYGYFFISREKKHHDWSLVLWFWAGGYSCTAGAMKHASDYGFPLQQKQRIVSKPEWLEIEARQILKKTNKKDKNA